MKLLTVQLPPFSCYFIILLGQNISLRILFWNTPNLCFSLNVTDDVPHPYKTTGRIMAVKFRQ
jgi:hypothetical protein